MKVPFDAKQKRTLDLEILCIYDKASHIALISHIQGLPLMPSNCQRIWELNIDPGEQDQ